MDLSKLSDDASAPVREVLEVLFTGVVMHGLLVSPRGMYFQREGSQEAVENVPWEVYAGSAVKIARMMVAALEKAPDEPPTPVQ